MRIILLLFITIQFANGQSNQAKDYIFEYNISDIFPTQNGFFYSQYDKLGFQSNKGETTTIVNYSDISKYPFYSTSKITKHDDIYRIGLINANFYDFSTAGSPFLECKFNESKLFEHDFHKKTVDFINIESLSYSSDYTIITGEAIDLEQSKVIEEVIRFDKKTMDSLEMWEVEGAVTQLIATKNNNFVAKLATKKLIYITDTIKEIQTFSDEISSLKWDSHTNKVFILTQNDIFTFSPSENTIAHYCNLPETNNQNYFQDIAIANEEVYFLDINNDGSRVQKYSKNDKLWETIFFDSCYYFYKIKFEQNNFYLIGDQGFFGWGIVKVIPENAIWKQKRPQFNILKASIQKIDTSIDTCSEKSNYHFQVTLKNTSNLKIDSIDLHLTHYKSRSLYQTRHKIIYEHRKMLKENQTITLSGNFEYTGLEVPDTFSIYALLANHNALKGCGIPQTYVKVDLSTLSSQKKQNLWDSIECSPIPTNSLINLEKVPSKGSFQIINQYGQIIKVGSLNKYKNSIDLSNYINGLYYLKCYNESEEIKSIKKIVIMK